MRAILYTPFIKTEAEYSKVHMELYSSLFTRKLVAIIEKQKKKTNARKKSNTKTLSLINVFESSLENNCSRQQLETKSHSIVEGPRDALCLYLARFPRAVISHNLKTSRQWRFH